MPLHFTPYTLRFHLLLGRGFLCLKVLPFREGFRIGLRSLLAVLCTAVVRRVFLCSTRWFCARGYPASFSMSIPHGVPDDAWRHGVLDECHSGISVLLRPRRFPAERVPVIG